MHGLPVIMKERLPFARVLFLENSSDSYVFDWLYFILCLTSSLSIGHLLRSCTVVGAISSNVDELLLISPSTDVFIFGDSNVHHKDWLNYSVGTDRPGELCSQMIVF